jgi:hypothetical protein
MKFEVTLDNALDVIGTGAAAYAAYSLAGGNPIPGFREFVPLIAALAVGVFVWRLVRKNNNKV